MTVRTSVTVHWLALLLTCTIGLAMAAACSGESAGDGTLLEPSVQKGAPTVSAADAGTTGPNATQQPSAPPEERVVGLGSAGPDSRDVQVPRSNDVIDTGGLPTVVFVDADG